MSKLRLHLKTMFDVDLQVIGNDGSNVIEGYFTASGQPFEMSPRAAAVYVTDGVKRKIVLREGATVYELFHEFMHFRHSQELGLDGYLRLGGRNSRGELLKEQYVYDKIVEHKELFTFTELKHAHDYLNTVYKRFGKEGSEFPFQGHPAIMPKKKTLSILNRK